MKENQKILYEHYVAVANNVKKNKGRDYPQIVRDNCKKYADEILKSFPDFEEKPKPKGKGVK